MSLGVLLYTRTVLYVALAIPKDSRNATVIHETVGSCRILKTFSDTRRPPTPPSPFLTLPFYLVVWLNRATS